MLKKPVFVFLLIFLMYLIGLWKTSIPLTGDQKVYLSIALEMFEKNEWMIPSLFDEPNFLKPPFQYWATLLGWKVAGMNMLGALLPSVLALLTSAILVFQIGKKTGLSNPVFASILFASTFGTMTYGSTAQMEIWIVLFYLAAWLAVLHSRLLVAFVLVGIMAWIKGPLYPVLWTMSYLVWDLKSIKTKKFWLALMCGVVIGLGWYLIAARTHAQEMLKQFFYTENLSKFKTPQGSVIGLWSEFLFSLFPWLLILITGVFQENTREIWKKNQRFYISYSLLSAVFFSFFPYRVNSYLYFLTPVMAMLASETNLLVQSKVKTAASFVYAIMFTLMIYITLQLYRGDWISAEIVWSAILLVLVFSHGFIKGKWQYIALSSLMMVSLVRVTAIQVGEKDIAGLREQVFQHPGEYAFYIDSKDIWHEFGLLSSAVGKPISRFYKESDFDSFLAQGGFVILQENQSITSKLKTECVIWERLKKRTKFPIQKLLKEGVSWGDPLITSRYQICSVRQ